MSDSVRCWVDGVRNLSPAALLCGLRRCAHDRPDPWPPSLPEFRRLCQPTPADLGLPSVEDAYRIATRQNPDWSGVHPIVWHARQAVAYFELVHEPAARTRPCFEQAYTDLARRALQGETFAFPDGLSLPTLPQPLPLPLTDNELADIQRRALALSPLDDPATRDQALTTAPVQWQPVIRHYLAWRLSRAAWQAHLASKPASSTAPSTPAPHHSAPAGPSPDERWCGSY